MHFGRLETFDEWEEEEEVIIRKAEEEERRRKRVEEEIRRRDEHEQEERRREEADDEAEQRQKEEAEIKRLEEAQRIQEEEEARRKTAQEGARRLEEERLAEERRLEEERLGEERREGSRNNNQRKSVNIAARRTKLRNIPSKNDRTPSDEIVRKKSEPSIKRSYNNRARLPKLKLPSSRKNNPKHPKIFWIDGPFRSLFQIIPRRSFVRLRISKHGKTDWKRRSSKVE
jgi:hypothetical protein